MQVYTDGDPCPDNCVPAGDRLRLFDFEFCNFRQALLDGAYGRFLLHDLVDQIRRSDLCRIYPFSVHHYATIIDNKFVKRSCLIYKSDLIG